MSMIDFPKIDSQGFFHDWNGFAMDRFNDPHLPSAGFTRRGVVVLDPLVLFDTATSTSKALSTCTHNAPAMHQVTSHLRITTRVKG